MVESTYPPFVNVPDFIYITSGLTCKVQPAFGYGQTSDAKNSFLSGNPNAVLYTIPVPYDGTGGD